MPPLTLGLGYFLKEVHKESILFCWGGWGTEGETRAPTEIIFMFPHSGTAEAPRDQVMIQVVTGFLDGHVTEETTVRIQDIVRPGPHLPHHIEHDLHTIFLYYKGIGMS